MPVSDRLSPAISFLSGEIDDSTAVRWRLSLCDTTDQRGVLFFNGVPVAESAAIVRLLRRIYALAASTEGGSVRLCDIRANIATDDTVATLAAAVSPVAREPLVAVHEAIAACAAQRPDAVAVEGPHGPALHAALIARPVVSRHR